MLTITKCISNIYYIIYDSRGNHKLHVNGSIVRYRGLGEKVPGSQLPAPGYRTSSVRWVRLQWLSED